MSECWGSLLVCDFVFVTVSVQNTFREKYSMLPTVFLQRIEKCACQIHGLFQLLRSQKSKLKTLPERYDLLVEGQSITTLGFRQACKYAVKPRLANSVV